MEDPTELKTWWQVGMLLGKLHTGSVWQFRVVLLCERLQRGRGLLKVLGKFPISLTLQKLIDAAHRGSIGTLSTCGIRILEIYM